MRRTETTLRHITAIALLALLATAALSACGSTTPQAAPPIKAATGLLPGGLAYPVVDQLHHVLYGYDRQSIWRLDERTGQPKPLFRLGKHDYAYFTAVDPAINRLLVEVAHTDQPIRRRHGLDQEKRTAFADVIDAQTGRLLASQPISQFEDLYGGFPGEGNVAIDTSLHHGFVTDITGSGVMIDTRSGRLLARFHAGEAVKFGEVDTSDPLIPATRTAVIDTNIHRLFLLFTPPNTFTNANSPRKIGWLAVIDTRNGSVTQRIASLNWGQRFLELDPRTQRIFAVNFTGVTVVDATTSRILRYRRVEFVDALGLDTAAGRFYVVGVPRGFLTSPAHLLWIDTRTLRMGQGIVLGSTKQKGGGWDYNPAIGVTDVRASRLLVWPENESNILSFDTRTGRLLARRPFPPSIIHLGHLLAMVVDEGTHRLYFTGSQAVLAVDTRTLK
jgi:hypothetical protein